MSEMFVSSLWKGDFSKLFTVAFVFKRGSQWCSEHNLSLAVKVVEGLEVTSARLQFDPQLPHQAPG